MKRNQIIETDVIEGLKSLPNEIINLAATSPPYSDVISYGNRVKTYGEDAYVKWMIDIGKEIRRVLTPNGSFIFNVGDKTDNKKRSLYIMKTVIAFVTECKLIFHDEYIWNKPSCMPSGSEKRLNNTHEYIFHFTKTLGAHKTFVDNVREPHKDNSINRARYKASTNKVVSDEGIAKQPEILRDINPKGKIPSSVFTFQTAGVLRDSGKHPAPFNPDLPEWFISYLTEKGDLVLDPFMGSGSTAVAAKRIGRDYIGFDITPAYIEMARKRVANVVEKIETKDNLILF